MKALHVIESLGRGGAEQLLVTLLPELARQGCGAEVAMLRGSVDLVPELEARGIKVTQLPGGHKWNLWRNARAIARLADQAGADVIHAHLYFPAVSVALMRLLRLHRARTVVSFHNLAYAGANRAGLALWAKKRLARSLYPRGFDLMLGVSSAVARHYEGALGVKQVQVLHNPVPEDVRPRPAPPDRPVPLLVVPGRLVSEKGHSTLIQALTCMKMSVQTVFAGGGPLQASLQDAAPNIRITGPLMHGEMLDEIAVADLVVIPSHHEGFGLTALEAMALGRPVLATDAGGLPEVLGEAGYLVPREDPNALADAIELLLNDPDLRSQLADAGKHRATELFSTGAIAAQLLSYYHGKSEKRGT